VPAKDPSRRRETARAWYQRTKHLLDAGTLARRDARRAARLRLITAWYAELKDRLACRVCGESHPACIQFHHSDSREKDMSISDAVRRGWGQARIEREIEKCEVLCANCHAKRHAQEPRDE
jgi:hypothetical protein